MDDEVREDGMGYVNVVIDGRGTMAVHRMRAPAGFDRVRAMEEFLKRHKLAEFTVREDGTAINGDGHVLRFEVDE